MYIFTRQGFILTMAKKKQKKKTVFGQFIIRCIKMLFSLTPLFLKIIFFTHYSVHYEPQEFFADPKTLNTLENGGIALLSGKKV